MNNESEQIDERDSIPKLCDGKPEDRGVDGIRRDRDLRVFSTTSWADSNHSEQSVTTTDLRQKSAAGR